ncbi:MAG: hypothetical protein KatS3mg068_1497 [Candidatus Sericytochromatia bacterium]|nr:MAG: hypothetical protein KatS3mg068_1497 [Candidatus Sericytochromatia bacterium]
MENKKNSLDDTLFTSKKNSGSSDELSIDNYVEKSINQYSNSFYENLKDINLLEDSVAIKLTVPVYFQDKKLVAVRIKRLYVKDISMLKKDLSKYDFSEGRNIHLVYRFFETILSYSLESFISEDGEDVDKKFNSRIISLIPVNNVTKLLTAIFLLNREKPYINANYECKSCNVLNMFDIDPEDPDKRTFPEGEFHDFMENIFDFMVEDYDIFDENFQEEFCKIELQKPFIIDYNEKQIKVETIYLKYPSIGLYNEVLSNPKKRETSELWVIYQIIFRINDLTEDETSYLKRVVGINNLFSKFHVKDFKLINDNLFRDGLSFEHSFTCMNCGAVNNVSMDLTNFFGYLSD